MHKKSMRISLVAVMMFVLSPAQAALVDNGTYTTDTVSGLDWLDLTETVGMRYIDAPGSHTGWRYATNAEIEVLFGQSFYGYYDTNALGESVSEKGDPTNHGEYADHQEDVDAYQALFGSNTLRTIGMYMDEDDELRWMGVYDTENWSVIYGLENTRTPSRLERNDLIGTYLVRSSVVPVPAAVWLFGSALAGLGWLRRKQAA